MTDKLLVGIVTYQRPQKVIRLLQSLQAQTYKNFDIAIFFDNNDTESLKIIKQETDIPFISAIIEEPKYIIGGWNLIHHMYAASYLGHITLCDDVELYPDCVENLKIALDMNFPDTDGVIGITQVYPNHQVFFQPTGQVLIGKKFLHRFEKVKYAVCCPNYIQWYQDEELLKFSQGLNKFSLSKEAKLIHWHPAYYKKEMDKTHSIVRGDIQKKDKLIYQQRIEKGLIWGKSFELIQ